MTPTDQHYHTQFSGTSGSAFDINIQFNHNNNNNTGSCANHMGGHTPVFFAPSSYIVNGGHKSAVGAHHQLQHHPNLALETMLTASRGPLMPMMELKEAIQGEETRNGNQRMVKAHELQHGGTSDYDLGLGPAGSTGDQDMSTDHDRLGGGEYEGGEILNKGSRRLGYDQVKALEKAFEVENRLDPERKIRLASKLGLQPRQVAVWFQNRRARWKTKQMERDYSLLKNKFEALKADRDKLLKEKDNLQAELARLKGYEPLLAVETKSKQSALEGEQGSTTLASGSLVVDDGSATAMKAPTIQAEEEEASADLELHEQKLLQSDSLSSSTEESDIQNDGAIEDSLQAEGGGGVQVAISSKSFNDEPDYYTHHWRLPTQQLLYKPTIKNEEWPDNTDNMNSFNVPIDNWYNW